MKMESPDEDDSTANTCKTHEKPVESVTPEGVLLCIECIKGEYRKAERKPVFDVALQLHDDLAASSKKLNEVADSLMQNELAEIESELSSEIRQYFNSLHELLYELEKKQTKEMESSLKSIFGSIISKLTDLSSSRHTGRARAAG